MGSWPFTRRRVFTHSVACCALGALLLFVADHPALSCDLVAAFDGCEDLHDGGELVESLLREGKIRELLRQLPADRETKADCVFYEALAVQGGEEGRRLELAIVDELLRRPTLAAKLVQAAKSVDGWGPFLTELNASRAELMVNSALKVARICDEAERSGELSVDMEDEADTDEVFPDWEVSELLDFFVAWSLLGEPVALDGMGRQNWPHYSAKLGAWWRKTQPEVRYDARCHRFIVQPGGGGRNGKGTTPFEVRMWITVPRVPYGVLKEPQDRRVFRFQFSTPF